MMAAAADAVILRARIQNLVIGADAEHPGDRGKEARPAGAALVFHRRREDRQIAARAREYALALFAIQRAGAGAVGEGMLAPSARSTFQFFCISSMSFIEPACAATACRPRPSASGMPASAL